MRSRVSWLLEKRREDDSERLEMILQEKRIPYKIIEFSPFEKRDYTSLFFPDDRIIVYGSLSMVQKILRTCSWAIGFCDLHEFQCHFYYPRLQSYLLNIPCSFLPFGLLKKQKDTLFQSFGRSDAIFIRPSSGFKMFTGKMFYRDSFNDEVEILQELHSMFEEDLVLISRPQTITQEWRVFNIQNRIVAASLYRENEEFVYQEGAPKDVLDFTQNVINHWYPTDLVWVVDIFSTNTGKLFVGEIGSFSCAGFYACNLSRLVQEVQIAVEMEDSLLAK